MQCGIYLLLFTNTYNSYIGKSKDIEKRFSNHKSSIRHKNHYNTLLNNENIEHLQLIILEECQERDLGDREVYWVKELEPTLNIAKVTSNNSMGCVGTDHGMSLYTKIEIKNAVSLLAKGLSYKDVQEQTNLPYNFIASLVYGVSHFWLDEEMPIEIKIVRARKRVKPTYTVIKNNILYYLEIPKLFCEQNNINYSNFIQMLKNTRPSANGYTFVSMEHSH